MFYKKHLVNFTEKAPVLDSLFNKIASPRHVTLLQKTPSQVFSKEICEIFKNTFFKDYLRMTAPELPLMSF